MGLDITSVSKATFVEDMDVNDDNAYDEGFEKGYTFTWTNSYFKGREDNLVDGFYEVKGKKIDFHWSYTGYGRWRDAVSLAIFGIPAEIVWSLPEPQFQALAEINGVALLIHFSDCEGTIGPVTSRKIADGFRKALELNPDITFGENPYNSRPDIHEIIEIFDNAADDGFVSFH